MYNQLHKCIELLQECSERAGKLRVMASDFDEKLELVRYNNLTIAEFGKLIQMIIEEKNV